MSKYTLIVPIAADTDKMGTEMPYLFGLDSNGLMYCVSTEDALRRIEEQVPFSPEIAHLIEFVRNSKLGIIK